MMRQDECAKRVTEFLNGSGPPRLFFFYRSPDEAGKPKENYQSSADKELVVNFGTFLCPIP